MSVGAGMDTHPRGYTRCGDTHPRRCLCVCGYGYAYMYVRTHEDTHTKAKYNPYIFLMSAGEGCESVSVCGTAFYMTTLQTYA